MGNFTRGRAVSKLFLHQYSITAFHLGNSMVGTVFTSHYFLPYWQINQKSKESGWHKFWLSDHWQFTYLHRTLLFFPWWNEDNYAKFMDLSRATTVDQAGWGTGVALCWALLLVRELRLKQQSGKGTQGFSTGKFSWPLFGLLGICLTVSLADP